MWSQFPLFGTTVLLAIMVCASYTFAVSVSAGVTGRLRVLQAARFGAYGTVALIGSAVLCLAYAFVSHDFRLRYVAHYSDRSMPTAFLLTSLWGGQDGSLLWWLFLLSVYIGACVKWLGRKYLVLQPYVIATLMAVVLFFGVLMAFAANPFSTSVAGARPDGEGLNPLLQNFYMIIHPPSLYIGFVGCAVPFAFAIAALVTGRLDTEWIAASRKFTLFSWLFLAIGNTLGMLWAYEELGWGGYWGWDPVENAAFLPFLTASAFIHSVMLQERRGLLKIWNVFLVTLTFFLTIFGTFLTRSGAIASVHSFAQSSIGTYFLWFLALLVAVVLTLVLYRWPELRDLKPTPGLRKAALATGWLVAGLLIPGGVAISKVAIPTSMKVVIVAVLFAVVVYGALELVYRRIAGEISAPSQRPEIESVWSREFTYLMNNWALLGFMVFVLVATTFPMISEALFDEKVTVGPPYYNAWVQPIGLLIFALMGIGSLFGWKKTSAEAMRRAFRAPTVAFFSTALLHVAFGRMLRFPAVVWSPAIYPGALGSVLRTWNAATPVLGVALVAFNAVVIVQEFVLLFRARKKSGAGKDVAAAGPLLRFIGAVLAALVFGVALSQKGSFPGTPSFLFALVAGPLVAAVFPTFAYTMMTLPAPSRRRYGGYIVHFGLVVMILGFAGKSWNVDKETALSPGQTYSIEDYDLTFVGPRMEVDTSKRMIFADVRVVHGGKDRGIASPAKFIYSKMPESPTTEVAMMHSIRDDLYLVVGTINPQTKIATLQIHINPLVGWIWFGALILIGGSIVCMWPELVPNESRAWSVARGFAGVGASISVGIVLALLTAPSVARAQSAPTQAGAGMSSLHAGSVEMKSDAEREVFSSLRCMCGSCARDLLSTCACGTAQEAREKIRAKMAAGEAKDQIVLEYSAEYGAASLAIPPNEGGLRAIYAFPILAVTASGIGIGALLVRWRRSAKSRDALEKRAALVSQAAETSGADPPRDPYDARLDEELRDLDA